MSTGVIKMDHGASDFSPQGVGFLSKGVRHGPLPGLGMQFLHLHPIDLGLAETVALEHSRRALSKGRFPLMDHRRM